METRALILGCGYVGRALARVLVSEGVQVTGTTRTDAGMAAIRQTGAAAVIADTTAPKTIAKLTDLEPRVVFDLVRPDDDGTGARTANPARVIAGAFNGKPIDALVYLSSTSVYGPRKGDLTDESTPPEPDTPAGRARLDAEAVYLNLHAEHGLPARVCRAPGIYGPGRTLRQRIETGAYRRAGDEERYVSRIHVDDLAAGLIAAWRRGVSGEVYLLCDDEPVTAQEYAELAAGLLAVPLPPAPERDDIRDELGASGFERRGGAGRCSNHRMRTELLVVLRYPSVREGLPAALRAEGVIP